MSEVVSLAGKLKELPIATRNYLNMQNSYNNK